MGTKKDTEGGDGMVAELELRSHFAGKRGAERKDISLTITVCGLMENFPARTVDISRTGILLQITHDLFDQNNQDLASFAFKVQQHFQSGADILFTDHGFGVTAKAIRVTHREVEGRATLLLAFRFRHGLADGQCDALGVEAPRPKTRRK